MGMTEAELTRVDNLEIGHYSFGSVKWPGLTDLRHLDLDKLVSFGQGTLTLYPDLEKPRVGLELNKEAVITLHVRPSKGRMKQRNADMLRDRLTKTSEAFGGKFISYDMEKWIFHVPHFN